MARPLILLVDGNALMHRAYHALPPLTSPDGEPTNATFGFTSTLLKVLADYHPEFAAAAWDVGKTFRHEKYKDYKATRPPMPDDLRVQMERVRDVVSAFSIASKFVEGYEADDVLAALSRQATDSGLDVLIVTGDTDALQLVGPHVRVLLSGRRLTDAKVYDEDAVRERYGLDPKQLVDFKSLKGDPSDNIPGVPGVGEVTAGKLLQQFPSVENVYEHLDQVDAKLRDKLAAHEAEVRRGKELIQLVYDLPVELDLAHSRVGTFNREDVVSLFRELGFHSLMPRVPGGPSGPSGQLSLFGQQSDVSERRRAQVEVSGYRCIQSEKALAEVVSGIRAAGACAVDTETTSVRPVEAQLVGVALSWAEGEAVYIPVGHRDDAVDGQQLSLDGVVRLLGPLLGDPKVAKCAHNASYDLIVLGRHGLPVEGLHFDTMLAAYLLEPSGRNLGLKGLALQELGIEMTPISELIGSGRSQLTVDRVPLKQVVPYASADADMTLRLVSRLSDGLKQKELWELFEAVEMPLVPVLMDMESTGVALDVGFLRKMSVELQSRLAELEDAIYHHVGYRLNLNSSQQLSEALFDRLGLPTAGVSRGKTGRYSTAADVLESLREAHPVVELLLEHRQLSKIKSTYVDALPELVNPLTGRLHTSWNQTGAVTGRISSSDPNLQNIPIRTDIGRRVRQAFVAPRGSRLLGADYSQVELRILAHISQDKNLLQAFHRGEDIHARTAASVYGVPIADVTPDMRRLAKTINFGLIYGMSDWGLAARTELTQAESGEFIDKYFGQFPRVKEYLERVKRQAAEEGCVETLLGRKRYFPELQAGSRAHGRVRAAAERMAINHPIQGTAADIIKLAMIRLHQELCQRRLRSKMILQVHDELVLETPNAELEEVTGLVRSVMEGAYALDAPLRVDIKTGSHWGEME